MTTSNNHESQSHSRISDRSGTSDRRPLYFLLIAICLLFVASYASRLARLQGVRNEIESTAQKIADATDRRARLEADLAYVSSNEYVEKVARDELDMALQGEQVITPVDVAGIEPAEAAESEVGAVEADTAPVVVEEEIWRQWVGLFAVRGE